MDRKYKPKPIIINGITISSAWKPLPSGMGSVRIHRIGLNPQDTDLEAGILYAGHELLRDYEFEWMFDLGIVVLTRKEEEDTDDPKKHMG